MRSTATVVMAWVGTVLAWGWFIAATFAEAYAAEEQLRDMRWTAWQSASLVVAIALLGTAAILTARAARRAWAPHGAPMRT